MSAQSTVFHFRPDPNATGGTVTREVTIVAPHQGGHSLNIKPLPLTRSHPDATVTHAKPGPNQGQANGNDFYIWVINPQVTDMDSGKVITQFNPPLKMTVVYLPNDEEKGNGLLSLCVAFRRRDRTWKYKILPTVQNRKKRTLTSALENLDPKDPVGIGVP